MRTGLDFKSAQFDHVRGEVEDWIKMSEFEDLKSYRKKLFRDASLDHQHKLVFMRGVVNLYTKY